MNFLTLENISKRYGEKLLFDNLSLSINKGQKIALIAKNGTGKTTLLDTIAGLEKPDGDQYTFLLSKQIKVAYLRQEPFFDEGDSAWSYIFRSENPKIQAVNEYEIATVKGEAAALQAAMAKMDDVKAWDIEARIKEILSKFEIKDLEQKVDKLSGGQKKRLALAKILIDEPDFLILDEPTNHLDLDMVEWLEQFLTGPNVTLFIVTHDRYFLERICTHIVELENGNLYQYRGGYSDYLEKKEARHQNESIVHDKNKKLLSKELEWMRRQPKARGTKAKSRIESFGKLEDVVGSKKHEEDIHIKLDTSRLGSKILEAHNISKSFDDLKIIENFTYKFKKFEKIGVVGKNGVGKTTFLKILTKEMRPDSGKIVVGDTIVFGYFTQSGMQLDQDRRVIDVIRDIADFIPMKKGHKLTAEQLLERFMFNRPHQQVYVSKLSGGEKRRLYLLTILMKNPNFLILDEPTNDLDILTLNILEEFLVDFPGCVLIVSHDRFMMDKLADHLFIFEGEGKIKDFNGRYSDYREEAKLKQRAKNKLQNENKKAKKQTQVQEGEGLSYEDRKKIKRIEKDIEKLEKRKTVIQEKFLEASLPLDEIQKLSKELDQIKDKIEEKEMEWMELAE